MSNPVNAIVPSGFQSASANFTAANTTIAKVLIENMAAAVGTTTAPAYYGGCTVVDLLAQTTETVARDIQLYQGEVKTTQAVGTTGTMTTTTSTIVRGGGSGTNITDGWTVGDNVMLFAPTANGAATGQNAAVDGILATITAVSASTLTVNGTPFAALTLAAGTRVCKMSPLLRQNVASGAGTNGSTRDQQLLGQGGSLLNTEIKLGANEIITAQCLVTLSALPVYMNVRAQIARY